MSLDQGTAAVPTVGAPTFRRFVDISGVGSSGKSALGDLLREFDCLYVPHFQFEFDLLRAPGGLLDLRAAVAEHWSPVRSHAAMRRFQRLVRTVGADPKPWDVPGFIRSSSQRYSRHFGAQYFDVWARFCEAMIVSRFRAEWPYDDMETSGLARASKRIAGRLGMRGNFLREVLLIDGERFDEYARRALTELYAPVVSEDHVAIVMNNAIEPFSPTPGLEMFGDAKQIVVIRDPRDIFASGQRLARTKSLASLQAFDNDGLNKTFLATDDVKKFCIRQRIYRQAVHKRPDPRILCIWFEDLVLHPKETTDRICKFLNLDITWHTRPKAHFDPVVSAKGVRIAKKYPDQEAINAIASALPDFLYPSW